MERIEKLLKEYKIRFKDTDRIKEDGYPFKKLSSPNTGNYKPEIWYQDETVGYRIYNMNGIVFHECKWATADLKEKPDKWVLEKNTESHLWTLFLEETGWQDESYCFNYYGNYWKSDTILDDKFKDSQLITLEQWYELFSTKVDFTILNDEDWFYSVDFLDKIYVFNQNIGYYCITTGEFRREWELIPDTIKILRKATEIDLVPFYERYPEFEPLKVGDLALLFDYKDREFKDTHYIINIIDEISKFRFKDARGISWKYAMKVSPNWTINELIERFNNYTNF